MMIEKLKNNYPLLAILLLASALRFYHIDFQSIWLDEIHTMIEGNPKMPYKEFYDIMVFREQMPHLYFLLVKVNSFIFGHSTFVVRMFSAVTGVLSVYAIYLLGKEIFNKKVGLIAGLLLSINYFHILYSQEARPYCLLCLFTILSFYRMVVFMKKNTYKNALYYGIFTALMINTHFFGLFVLVSQALIILCLLVELPSNERKKFFLSSFLAGILTIVFWLPSYKIFLIITEIKSFWIQMPTLEVYTSLFKEFFGSAEAVVFIAFILSLFYFIKLFQEKNEKNNLFIQNKKIFSFIIISIWVFITLLIPYIRTYVDIPMIISRYFISVLPATLLILSIAIAEIKSKATQRIVVIVFVIVSLTDVIIVKDYYNKISKTQYREMTQKIIEKNKSNAIIVSTWGWHLRYFFTNDSVKMETKEQTLQEFVDNMKQNPTQARNFWFLGAHFQTYQLTPDAEAYLNSNFNLVESLEFHDTWARYYVSKTNKKLMTKPIAKSEFNLSLFSPIQLDGNGNLNLFENTSIKTDFMVLEKGNYNLIISGKSLPEKPINGENAHFRVKLNGEEIASFYLSENKKTPTKIIPFCYNKNEEAQFQLIYDNDVFENGNDRNAIIYSIALKNKDK